MREDNSNSEKRLIFERGASVKDQQEMQRLLITIKNDNSLTIDAVNFKGRSCKEVTDPFANKVGVISERKWKEEARQILGQSKNINTQKDTVRERRRI